DEWIVDHSGLDILLRQFRAGFNGFAQQRTAGNQHHIAALLQHLRFAPLVSGVFDPGERIIFAPDEEDVGIAIFAARAVGRVAFDGLIHERLSLLRTRWRDSAHDRRYP